MGAKFYRPKNFRLQLLIAFSSDIYIVQLNLLTESVTSKLSSFIIASFLQFLNVF